MTPSFTWLPRVPLPDTPCPRQAHQIWEETYKKQEPKLSLNDVEQCEATSTEGSYRPGDAWGSSAIESAHAKWWLKVWRPSDATWQQLLHCSGNSQTGYSLCQAYAGPAPKAGNLGRIRDQPQSGPGAPSLSSFHSFCIITEYSACSVTHADYPPPPSEGIDRALQR